MKPIATLRAVRQLTAMNVMATLVGDHGNLPVVTPG
jgi:hypothetical protein